MNFTRSLWTLACILHLLTRAYAVDPPPAYVLQAPVEQQLQYARQVSSDSEWLRTKVARRRFEEKQQMRQALVAGLQDELIRQQAMMSQSSALPCPTEEIDTDAVAGTISGTIARGAGLVCLGLVLVVGYLCRKQLADWLFSTEAETERYQQFHDGQPDGPADR